MNFDEIIGMIPVIYSGSFIKLPPNLENRTEFVEMARFTSSTNPIATWGIGPCLGIGISGGGVNYLEHVNPHDYVRNGRAISRMEQVILKFREYGQTPSVYLFRLGLGPEISAVIDKLYNLGLVESGNVFFCNTTNIFLTDNYVGIYNNKPFYFQKRIENPSYNNSKNFLNLNFSNTNVQKAKQFSVGDYVMISGLPYTYVIFRINPITSRITLCNLSIKNEHSENMYKTVNPDQLVKKISYSNTVRGRTTYSIPDDIQNIINKSKNK